MRLEGPLNCVCISSLSVKILPPADPSAASEGSPLRRIHLWTWCERLVADAEPCSVNKGSPSAKSISL